MTKEQIARVRELMKDPKVRATVTKLLAKAGVVIKPMEEKPDVNKG